MIIWKYTERKYIAACLHQFFFKRWQKITTRLRKFGTSWTHYSTMLWFCMLLAEGFSLGELMGHTSIIFYITYTISLPKFWCWWLMRATWLLAKTVQYAAKTWMGVPACKNDATPHSKMHSRGFSMTSYLKDENNHHSNHYNYPFTSPTYQCGDEHINKFSLVSHCRLGTNPHINIYNLRRT